MSVVVTESKGKNFTPPSRGIHQAVLAEVVALDPKEVVYASKKKTVNPGWLIFQSTQVNEDGKRQELWHYVTNMSLGTGDKPSNLRKFLVEWLGPREVGSKMDLSALVGKTAELMVKHVPAKNDPDRVYANIASISAGDGETVVTDYTPFAERKKKDGDDEDLPF